MAKAKKDFMSGYATYDTSEGYGSRKEWRKAFGERMNEDEAKAILNDQELAPHEILGVSANATQQEIKKAYRKLAMQWHPDKHNNSEEATAMMKKINAAYAILSK